MGYTLIIGDRMYSSWSLRGWLLFGGFGIAATIKTNRMYRDEFLTTLKAYGPARTVPALAIDDARGARFVWDTLAMAETLAEENPDAGLWPRDPAHRAAARSIVAEMHSGFGALRGDCAMNLRHTWTGFEVRDAVHADLARLDEIWAYARQVSGSQSGWLFGEYSAADVFFAPVAARIAGYGLPVSDASAAYVARHLDHLPFRQWRAMAFAENFIQDAYTLDLPTQNWPGPVPLEARAVAKGEPINGACPYSSKPVAADSLAEIDGRIVGFCNTFCRDKSVADPLAWPKLVALLESLQG